MTTTMRQQFGKTVLSVGREDADLAVVTAGMSVDVLKPFAEEFASRYVDVGIAEATAISVAAGLARTGFAPVVHTIAPFLVERGFEQLKVGFCLQKLRGNLVTIGGAFDYTGLGPTHFCYGDFALLRTLPGTQVVFPGTAAEFDLLFRQAYANDLLTAFRTTVAQHHQDVAPADTVLGRAVRMADGHDLTLVATGSQLDSAMGARALLSGWSVEVLYIHTLRPLDVEAVRASSARTRRVLVIEEHLRSGGLGEEVLRHVHDVPGVRVVSSCLPDGFTAMYGTYADHCAALGLTPAGVADHVRRVFGEQPG